MKWGRRSAAFLLGLLLCVNFQGSCAPEAEVTTTGPPKTSDAALPSPDAQKGKTKEENDLKATSEVGLLAEDSSKEKERVLGVLEKRRRESSSSDSRSSDSSPQQSQNESSETPEKKNEDERASKCSRACKKEWISDGWCDTACNTKDCEFDGGDCEGWCSGDCKPTWEGDGFCDAACYVEACKWDGGDCEDWRSKGIQAVDRRALQKQQKQLNQHRLQLPDCKCERRLLVNGSCTPECNVPECLFDGGECLDMCNAKCAKSWLGDGDCDRDCDTAECGYDKGDCDSNTNATLRAMRKANDTEVCNSSCRLWMITNSVCDSQCNNVACGFDGGDCDNVTAVLEVDYAAKPEVYQFCAKEWIGDGHCDPNCFNKASKWDGGDCEGTPLEMEQAEKGIGPQFD